MLFRRHVRAGPEVGRQDRGPDDEDFDYDTPIWAGILPMTSSYETLVDGDRLIEGVEPSGAMKALEGKAL